MSAIGLLITLSLLGQQNTSGPIYSAPGLISPTLNRRPTYSQLLNFMAPGGWESNECACADLTASTGQALTSNRATTAYCAKSDGTLVLCAAMKPRVQLVSAGQTGLLQEAAATNLALRSEETDNATWTKEAGAVTANAGVAPNGATTMDQFIEDGTTAQHRFYQGNVSFTSGAIYALSFWVKQGNGSARYVLGGVNDTSGLLDCVVNPATGAVTNCVAPTTGSCSFVSNAAAFRCTVLITAAATTAVGFVIFNEEATLGTISYAGDSTSGVYVWGVQLEATPFASSYIPTTSASVTRSSDISSLTYTTPLADGQDPYCMTATFAPLGPVWTALSQGLHTIGSTNNRNTFMWVNGGNNVFKVRMFDGTGAQKQIETNAGVSAATHTYLFTNNGGTLAIKVDGSSPASTVTGAGTGLNTSWGATTAIGGPQAGSTNGLLYKVITDNTLTGCDP